MANIIASHRMKVLERDSPGFDSPYPNTFSWLFLTPLPAFTMINLAWANATNHSVWKVVTGSNGVRLNGDVLSETSPSSDSR